MDQQANVALGAVILLTVPFYLMLQAVTPLFLKGPWRMAALLPLVFAVPLAAYCALAFYMQSNLWPLLFILFSPFGAAYLLLVIAIRFGVYWRQRLTPGAG